MWGGLLGSTSGFSQRAVLWSLVNKNIKAQYAGSVLGLLWAFINPLLLALIVGFVFTNILNVTVSNFYIYIISGMLPWGFFSVSLLEASLSIPRHASFLKQFPLSKSFIPAAAVLSNFILLLFSLMILLPLFILVSPKIVFMLPVLVMALVLFLLFTFGISLITSVMCVEWQDMRQVLNMLMMYWLWLTPVFYSVDMVPSKYKILLLCNPVNVYLSLFRNALFDGKMPTPWAWGVAVVLALIMTAGGLFLFSKREGGFLKKI
ncbi:MAG: ABC transporter permease [Candidatus Omnitrophota bacterium]